MPSRLSVQHRQSQIALRAATLRDLLKLWPAFDVSRIAATWEPFEAGLLVLIERSGRTSSGLAVAFYQEQRDALGVKGTPTPKLGSVDTDEMVKGLRVVGPANAGMQLAKGRSVEAVRQATLVNVSGEVSRHVMNFGRRTLVESVKADRRAFGWQRVTSGKACDFCSMLAGRGAVYKESTGEFEAHRHCSCVAEPVYR
jgi:hypothetical protein